MEREQNKHLTPRWNRVSLNGNWKDAELGASTHCCVEEKYLFNLKQKMFKVGRGEGGVLQRYSQKEPDVNFSK